MEATASGGPVVVAVARVAVSQSITPSTPLRRLFMSRRERLGAGSPMAI